MFLDWTGSCVFVFENIAIKTSLLYIFHFLCHRNWEWEGDIMGKKNNRERLARSEERN